MDIKLVSIGVGKTGKAGDGSLRGFGVDETLLKDVFGDASTTSGTETVKPLFLKPVAALVPKRAGELGTLLSLSAEVTLVSAEAVDETMSVESDPGKGDDPFRLLGRSPGDGVDLKPRLGRFC